MPSKSFGSFQLTIQEQIWKSVKIAAVAAILIIYI